MTQGGGEVHLRIPIVRTLPPISLTDEGMVKRVRGMAYSCRMPPQTSNRLVDGVRGMLNDLLADVYVFTDHMSGAAAGLSPGYGVALVAETTSGRYLAAQVASDGIAKGQQREQGDEVCVCVYTLCILGGVYVWGCAFMGCTFLGATISECVCVCIPGGNCQQVCASILGGNYLRLRLHAAVCNLQLKSPTYQTLVYAWLSASCAM